MLAPRGSEPLACRTERLPAAAAFASLLHEMHAPTPAIARAVAHLVADVPVLRLHRYDDLAALPATVRAVTADMGWRLPRAAT